MYTVAGYASSQRSYHFFRYNVLKGFSVLNNLSFLEATNLLCEGVFDYTKTASLFGHTA
jgi:hypothetical protein